MPGVSSDNAKHFKYLEPLSWGVLLGVPFFLLGCAFAAWLIGWFVIGVQVVEQAPLTVLFVGVGALLVLLQVLSFGRKLFARRGLVIDRERDTLAVLGGLFVPRVVATHRLADFCRLRIRPVTVKTGRASSRTDYHLDLVGPGETSVGVAEETTYTAARDLAEKVGAFLRWDVEDATGPSPMLLPAHALVKSLAEQAGGGQSVPLPEPPADRVGAVTLDGDRVVYRIPPRGGPGCLVSFLLVTALVAAGFVFGFLTTTSGKAGLIAFEVVVLLFWCIGLVTLVGELERTTVDLDGRGVRVRRTRLVLTTVRDFPLASIREVRQQGTQLRLIAEGGEVTFGHPRLTEAELAWLQGVILQTARQGERC
jgi:hypothetical protein